MYKRTYIIILVTQLLRSHMRVCGADKPRLAQSLSSAIFGGGGAEDENR